MGYTHYWAQPAHSSEEFDKIGDVVAKIIRLAWMQGSAARGGQVKICGPLGKGKPKFLPQSISFNGAEPNFDHETFKIAARGTHDFCKTARKPYDLVVTACLAYLASRHGWSVSSDGDASDWEQGVELASEALGEPVPNPLIVAQLEGAG